MINNNNNIADLHNRSSEALINAMGQYIEYLGLKSSINRLDIQRHYFERISQNDIATKFSQLDAYDKRRNLTIKKDAVKQNIIIQIQQSTIYALALIDSSIITHNKIGLDAGKNLINSIFKFISDNKSDIQIPMGLLQPQIMTIQSNLTGYGYQNIDLINALNQLLMV